MVYLRLVDLYGKIMVNVDEYASPMDPMGKVLTFFILRTEAALLEGDEVGLLFGCVSVGVLHVMWEVDVAERCP